MSDREQPLTFRCADASRTRDDPQLGSAPVARRWLLIEHRGPWRIDALAGAELSPAVTETILRTAAAQQARPLLIRRTGRAESGMSRRWAVSYAEGATVWGRWDTDEDLRAATDALAAPAPTPAPADLTDPLLLVCTHGLHDACCAIRGRPVAAALAREWPEATWECSHVGGDRFAANIVVLPDGVYYGNLDPVDAVQTVRAHLTGEVPVAHLRGMTSVPPPAQVAIAAIHERFGPFGARDVAVTRVEHTSPGVWLVELTATSRLPGPVLVRVTSTRRDPAQLTCRAAAETPATQYHVRDVRPG